MKKLFIVTFILFLISNPAFAGNLNLGAKASIYNPSVPGASPTIMYGIVADYDVNQMIHARGSVEYATYSIKDTSYSLMPVTVDIIAHLFPGFFVDPYFGGGVGYYKYTAGSVETSTTGLQAVAGISASIGAFYAGFEAKYYIPDASKTSEGQLSYGGYMTGAYGVTIPF